MEKYQIGWLEFLIDEILVEKKLIRLAESLTKFWIHTVRDDTKRERLIQKIMSVIGESDL